MRQFSVSNEAGKHIGFMVFMSEEEEAQYGVAMLRLLSDTQEVMLARWANQTLRWVFEGQMIVLHDEDDDVVGRVQAQYLSLAGKVWQLTDLEGNL